MTAPFDYDAPDEMSALDWIGIALAFLIVGVLWGWDAVFRREGLEERE